MTTHQGNASETQANGVLVPLATGQQGLKLIAGIAPQFWSSLNPNVPAEQELLFKAAQGFDIDAQDHLDMEMDLRHVYAENVEKIDANTGETINLTRVCLIDPDGMVVQTFSNGIKKSLAFLIQFFGIPPYNPPRRVKIDRVKTSKGFYMFRLTPVAKVLGNAKTS